MNGAARVLTNMRKFDRGMTHARATIFTGWTFLTASNIDCASLFTSAYMEWHHSTCLISVRLKRRYMVVNVFARLIVDSCRHLGIG